MTTVTISYNPFWNFQYNGTPAVGFQLFTYAAGTTNKIATYTDSTGSVTLPNPILLNAFGDVANATGASSGLWTPPGQAYKYVLALPTDTDPPTSPIKTIDNVIGPLTASTFLLTADWAPDSGAVNAYILTPPFSIALTTGLQLRFQANVTNTGAATINAGGTGAIAVVNDLGTALTGGEILSTAATIVRYTGSVWQIVSGDVAPPYARTAAEIAASVTPVNYGYAPGNVLRYGGDPTGVADSTSAWTTALSQRQHGGEAIDFRTGAGPALYKGNFIVTGQNVVIRTQEPFYEDTNTVGFIANNTANPVWQVGDGSTLTTSIKFEGGLKMHGQGTAAKGFLINGASNVWLDMLISRGFTTYSFSYTASTTQPSAYVFINNYRIDPAASASAIGFVMTQPANFPTSYATALFFNHGAISAVTGSLWAVQINANSTCWVENSYWSMRNAIGLNFSDAGGTGQINCANLFIDTLSSSNDELITCAGSFALPQNLTGTVSVNGKVRINGNLSAVTLQGNSGYLGFRTMMFNPSVTGSLDFQDGSAGVQDQTAHATQTARISRSGSTTTHRNDAQAFVNAAGTGDAALVFGSSSVRIVTGTGSPSSSLPNGSIYLQTDAGAASPLWIRANSAWSQVTLP